MILTTFEVILHELADTPVMAPHPSELVVYSAGTVTATYPAVVKYPLGGTTLLVVIARLRLVASPIYSPVCPTVYVTKLAAYLFPTTPPSKLKYPPPYNLTVMALGVARESGFVTVLNENLTVLVELVVRGSNMVTGEMEEPQSRDERCRRGVQVGELEIVY